MSDPVVPKNPREVVDQAIAALVPPALKYGSGFRQVRTYAFNIADPADRATLVNVIFDGLEGAGFDITFPHPPSQDTQTP